MRFISLVKATKEFEAGVPPSQAIMEAIGKLAMEAMQEGTMIDMGGLAPSSMGARVRTEGGKITVVDGPFAEVKELVAGYAVMEVASREQAIEEARKFMQVHLDVLGPDYVGECELRQIFGGKE